MSVANLKISRQEVFYLPNILTYLRLLSLPLIYHFLVKENLLAVGLLTVLGISTDIFDGILARKLNQSSNLGKILDPLADKIGMGVFAIYVVLYKDFPLWAALLVIIRDLAIVVGGVFMLRKVKEVPVSDIWGKLTALSWTLCILAYILDLNLAKQICLALALALTFVSIFRYFRRFLIMVKKTQVHL